MDFQICETCFEVYDKQDQIMRCQHRNEVCCRICYKIHNQSQPHVHQDQQISEFSSQNLPFHWTNQEIKNYKDATQPLPDWWESFGEFFKRRHGYLELEKGKTRFLTSKDDFKEFFRVVYQRKVQKFCELTGILDQTIPINPPTQLTNPPTQLTNPPTQLTNPPQLTNPISSANPTVEDTSSQNQETDLINLSCRMIQFQQIEKRDFVISISPLSTVLMLKIKINKHCDLKGWKSIRLIQLGQQLADDRLIVDFPSKNAPIFVIYRPIEETIPIV